MATVEYIPIIGSQSNAHLKVAYINGLSTKHDSTHSNRGRMYATVSASGHVDIYSNHTKQAGERVLTGAALAEGEYFDLEADNASGLSGRAWLASYGADEPNLILVPTFAVDADVLVDAGQCAALPGYDAGDGLAELHAQAMRTLLTDALPAAVPNLFGGVGLAAFVPQGQGVELPDLSSIASVDQLRIAQASLVKALAAEQAEHLEEWAAVAAAARQRYREAMARLAEANTKDEQTSGADTSAGWSAGSFLRG